LFLNLLTPPQQRVFVQGARAVAEQDGELAEVEQALIAALQAECGLDELPAAQDAAGICAAAVAVLDSDLARRVFILELAGVAVIDGEAHAAEVALVGEIAVQLGIEGAELAEMLAFAGRARALVVDGQRLIATTSLAS